MTPEKQFELINQLQKKLREDLFAIHGPVMTGEPLQKALGYISQEAFRQAQVRKLVFVPIFELENRRGKFALVDDVAQFLAEQRYKIKDKSAKKEVEAQNEY